MQRLREQRFILFIWHFSPRFDFMMLACDHDTWLPSQLDQDFEVLRNEGLGSLGFRALRVTSHSAT